MEKEQNGKHRERWERRGMKRKKQRETRVEKKLYYKTAKDACVYVYDY